MADIPTVSWSEDTPAGSSNISLGDNRIRELKTQIREVIDVDHDFPSSGKASDNGQHKKVTLQEQADLGTGATGVPILGAQTVSGKAELLFTDEDDNDIQLTSGGKLKITSGRLENNAYITARNNAGSGDLNVVKANASDQAEFGLASLFDGGVILPEISAPTTAANQGALYTKNDGTQTELYFREESSGDEVQITKGGTLFRGIGGWVNCDVNGNINASYNVDSVVKNGAGDYTITWTNDFADANYVVSGSILVDNAGKNGMVYVLSQAAGSVRILVVNDSAAVPAFTNFMVMAIGNQ